MRFKTRPSQFPRNVNIFPSLHLVDIEKMQNITSINCVRLYLIAGSATIATISHLQCMSDVPFFQQKIIIIFICIKSKAIPLTGLGGLEGCEMVRIPHYIDNRLTDGGKDVSPTHPQHSTPQKRYYFLLSSTHFR
jgi:hypothetical protein